MGKSRQKLQVKLFSGTAAMPSGPSRSTIWRHKLKTTNPTKYDDLQKKDRERKKVQYNIDKQDNTRAGKLKRKERREKKTQQRRVLRARCCARADVNQEEVKVAKEKTARNEYMRLYMKKRREKQTRQKKQYLKKKDRERKTRQTEPGGEQLDQIPDDGRSSSSLGYTSRAAKQKNLRRLRSQLPKSPSKFVDVVSSLVDSSTPRKWKLLEEHGVLPKKKRKKNSLLESFGEETQELARSCRKDGSAATRVVRQSLTQCVANIVKKKYYHNISWNYASRHFGLHWRQKKKSSTGGPAKPSMSARKRRKDATPHRVEAKVKEFYCSQAVSQTRPDKKFGKKGKPTYIMMMTFQQAYTKWRIENPTTKLSFNKFYQLKPKNVKGISYTKHIGCLCVYCVNVTEKLRTINNRIHALLSNPDLAEGTRQNLKDSILNDENEYISMLLCEKSSAQRFHDAKCIRGECESCGNLERTIQEFYSTFLEASGNEHEMKWRKWELKKVKITKKERGSTQVQEKEVTRRVYTEKQGTATDLVKDLIRGTVSSTSGVSYISHLFASSWQSYQVDKILKEAVKKEVIPGLVVLIQDFGRNFSSHYQNEIKSAHWVKKEITIHPIVSYYVDPSTKLFTRDALIFLTDDLTHDHHAVAKFLDVATNHLKDVRGLNMNMQIQVNDGCASQYKKAAAFVDISYGKDDYGCVVERTYYGSEHGKSEADGETSVVKGQCERAILSGQAVIDTAQAMYQFCEKHLSIDKDDKGSHITRRAFFLVPKAEIDHQRPERCKVKTVPKTRKIHSVQAVSPLHIKKRNFSCFCIHCLRGQSHECTNLAYAGPWEHVKLKPETENRRAKHSQGKPQRKKMKLKVLQQESAVDNAVEVTDGVSTKRKTPDAQDLPQQKVPKEMGQQQESPTLPAQGGPENVSPQRKAVACGDYVALPLFHKNKTDNDLTVYVAWVAKKTESEVQVRFMQRTGSSGYTFIWPPGSKGEQLYTHPVEDILHILPAPLLQVKGRSLQYIFSPADMESVTQAARGKVTVK